MRACERLNEKCVSASFNFTYEVLMMVSRCLCVDFKPIGLLHFETKMTSKKIAELHFITSSDEEDMEQTN